MPIDRLWLPAITLFLIIKAVITQKKGIINQTGWAGISLRMVSISNRIIWADITRLAVITSMMAVAVISIQKAAIICQMAWAVILRLTGSIFSLMEWAGGLSKYYTCRDATFLA